SDQRERYELLPAGNQEVGGHQHINQRIENARQELFWRYYASQALQLPLQLDMLRYEAVTRVDQLPAVNESLVGWLALSGSSQTFLTPAPSFEYAGQYRLYQLRAMQEGVYK